MDLRPAPPGPTSGGAPAGVATPGMHVDARDGTRLAIHVEGAHDAQPVVLLHGAPQTSYCWRHVVRQLHQARPGRYRTLAVDLRGYGDSELSRSGRYDIGTLVSDLETVVSAATGGDTARRVLLVAHDWGGPIGWLFAQRHPDQVRHLVAVNAPHPAAFAREVVHARQAFRSWYIALFQVPRLERALAARHLGVKLLIRMMTGSAPKDVFGEADLAVYRRALERPGRVDAVVAYYREIFRSDVSPEGRASRPGVGSAGAERAETTKRPTILDKRAAMLASPRITSPATIVWGTSDLALAPSHPDAVRPYASRLEVRPLTGVSHWVPEERPGAVVQAILDGDGSS